MSHRSLSHPLGAVGVPMKILTKVLLAAACVSLYAAPAAASKIVDPVLGASGSFNWVDGLGPIDGIDFTGETDFSLTAGAGDTVDVFLEDFGAVGDQFELTLNSVALTGSVFVAGTGHYSYTFDDVVLTAGANIFGINVIALAPGFTAGGLTSYRFSPVTAGTPGVPEPAAWALMLLGFGGIGAALRRRTLAVQA